MKNSGKKTIYTSFVTTPEMYSAIKKASVQQERSQSWIIGKAVELYLTKLGILRKSFYR
ncbi:MAG: hypothetical protein ABIG11_07810 [bacterium]